MNKKGDYINTFTGIKFYPLDPDTEQISIIDIAHALSFMTRANGHLQSFYTVAQHSVNCAKEAKVRGYSSRIQLGCLLHDGSEAYLSDITRPVKQYLYTYRRLEAVIQSTVFEKFGLSDLTQEEVDAITTIDNDLLFYEFEYLHDHVKLNMKANLISDENDFSERLPKEVNMEFLSLFEKLIKEI